MSIPGHTPPTVPDPSVILLGSGTFAFLEDNGGGTDYVMIDFLWPVDFISVEFRVDRAVSAKVELQPSGWSQEQNADPNGKITLSFSPGSQLDDQTSMKITFVYDSGEIQLKNLVITICEHLDNPCECRLRGDPILLNCNKKIDILPAGDFILSKSTDPGCEYEVSVNNGHFQNDPNKLIVTNYMDIVQGSNSIRIFRDHTISVNGGPPQDTAEGLSWATVSKNADDFVLVELNDCDAKFQFWGQSMATRGIVQIPGGIVGSSSGRCVMTP